MAEQRRYIPEFFVNYFGKRLLNESTKDIIMKARRWAVRRNLPQDVIDILDQLPDFKSDEIYYDYSSRVETMKKYDDDLFLFNVLSRLTRWPCREYISHFPEKYIETLNWDFKDNVYANFKLSPEYIETYCLDENGAISDINNWWTTDGKCEAITSLLEVQELPENVIYNTFARHSAIYDARFLENIGTPLPISEMYLGDPTKRIKLIRNHAQKLDIDFYLDTIRILEDRMTRNEAITLDILEKLLESQKLSDELISLIWDGLYDNCATITIDTDDEIYDFINTESTDVEEQQNDDITNEQLAELIILSKVLRDKEFNEVVKNIYPNAYKNAAKVIEDHLVTLFL